jgi:hypothetical protein
MTQVDLLKRLAEEAIPQSSYCLGDFPADECLVLRQNSPSEWTVYYSERGLRTGEAWFGTESEACAYILDKLLREKR